MLFTTTQDNYPLIRSKILRDKLLLEQKHEKEINDLAVRHNHLYPRGVEKKSQIELQKLLQAQRMESSELNQLHNNIKSLTDEKKYELELLITQQTNELELLRKQQEEQIKKLKRNYMSHVQEIELSDLDEKHSAQILNLTETNIDFLFAEQPEATLRFQSLRDQQLMDRSALLKTHAEGGTKIESKCRAVGISSLDKLKELSSSGLLQIDNTTRNIMDIYEKNKQNLSTLQAKQKREISMLQIQQKQAVNQIIHGPIDITDNPDIQSPTFVRRS